MTERNGQRFFHVVVVRRLDKPPDNSLVRKSTQFEAVGGNSGQGGGTSGQGSGTSCQGSGTSGQGGGTSGQGGGTSGQGAADQMS